MQPGSTATMKIKHALVVDNCSAVHPVSPAAVCSLCKQESRHVFTATAGALLVTLVFSTAGAAHTTVQQDQEMQGTRNRSLKQTLDRTTGLIYNAQKGLRSPPNATRPGYRFSRSKANILRSLGSSTEAEVAQAVCGQDAISGADCLSWLLLGLTPAAYSSNNTADTPRRRAFISPAQDQSTCSACVGFAFTAAAEAAVNVHLQQSWDKLSLSEQDASFCKLVPRVDCTTGMTYEKLVENVLAGRLQKWASRECLPYEGDASRSCTRADACASELPKGGVFSLAYGGSALNSIGKVKSQIMLSGGVLTSIAMSQAVFDRFKAYSSTSGVFETTEDLSPSKSDAASEAVYMHALFCYGWRDAANGDGHWLCKNSWSTRWGNNGVIRIAYAAAYVMQPDYTFALQFHQASSDARAAGIKARLRPDLRKDSTKPGCILFTPKQPQRLVKLVDDLATLADTSAAAVSASQIYADIITSNLGYVRDLAAASRGPFNLCGSSVQLLVDLLPPTAQSPSPQPRPSPSPKVIVKPSPSPRPSSGTCAAWYADSTPCKLCVKQLVMKHSATCVLKHDGGIVCAGGNEYGDLGTGDMTPLRQLTPAAEVAKLNVSIMALGFDFMCMLARQSSGNAVYCLGNNHAGQLGNSDVERSLLPVGVDGIMQSPRISQLASSLFATCVLIAGSVQCWGSGLDAQNSRYIKFQATYVQGVEEAVSIAVGDTSGCALLKKGTISCWDFNTQLVAVEVPELSSVVSIAIAASNKCAVVQAPMKAKSLWCWGAYNVGFLSESMLPWQVTGLMGNVIGVALGY